MPRRSKPDPLAKVVGQRIRQLRQEAALTMEKLAFESELGSKGHLSNLERGLARPTIQTLKVLADRLGVALLDLVTFPEEDERQRLVDRTRSLRPSAVRRLLKEMGEPAKPSGATRRGKRQSASPVPRRAASARARRR